MLQCRSVGDDYQDIRDSGERERLWPTTIGVTGTLVRCCVQHMRRGNGNARTGEEERQRTGIQEP